MKHRLLHNVYLSLLTVFPAAAVDTGSLTPGGTTDWHISFFVFGTILLGIVAAFSILLLRNNRNLSREIRRRELMQAELVGAKNRYQMLVDNLPQSVFWKDLDGRYVSVNRTYAQQLGRSPSEVAGTTDEEYFSATVAQKLRADDLQVVRDGTTGEFVDRIHFDKGDRWVHIVRTPLAGEGGTVSGVLGIFWDISDQKAFHDTLRETQRFNESVMRSTLDLVYIYDLVEDTAVYINAHLSEVLGFTLAEVRVMGGGFHHRLIHPDDQWLVDDMLVRCDGHRQDMVESLELRMHDAVGRWLWFAGRYVVFRRDGDGRVRQVIGTLHDITERVTVENALRIAFDRAQRYLDIVETVIVALDRDGHITLINRKGALVLGYQAVDLIGKSWFETCLAPADRSESIRFFNRLISEDTVSVEYFEDCVVTADGKLRFFAWHYNVLHDEKGSVLGVLSAGEDITERKHAEQIVRTEKFRQNILLTLSQVPDLSVTTAMDHALDTALLLTESTIGYLYFYSQAQQRFSLYSWSNEVMKSCAIIERQTEYELAATGLWGDAVRLRQPVVTNDYPGANPSKRGLPEGHVPLVRHLNLPVFDDGEIVAVIGVANKEKPYTDDDVRHLQLLMDGVWKIKKRIEMEQQIRRLNEDLERKVDERTGEVKRVNEELARFFTLALDLLCIASIDGFLIRCNKAWELTLGYPLGDLEGKRFIDFVHPDDVASTLERVVYLAKGGGVVDFVNRYRCFDGSYRWIEWRSTSAGNQIYAAARDITGKKHDEEALIRARDEADQANRSKSRFLANISHEIRTPLNAVIGYSELLSTLTIGKKEHGYAESISLAGRNLLKLISDILDLSKIEADMMSIRFGPVDLVALLGEIGQIFSFQIHEKSLAFSIDIDPPLPRFLVLDEVRIRQILLNIVGNAIKFTDHGFIRIKVICNSLPSEQSKVDLDIIVEDSGIGIAIAEQGAIFEAFRQQNNQLPQYGGTGLGLSISRKLLEMMHGCISVESTPGQGSKFSIKLPEVAVASIALVPATNGTPLPQPVFAPCTVLVVDDIPSNREMIATLLRGAGLNVLMAQNGHVAVELARQHHPECLIMDVLMPVLDGISAAKVLRADPATAAIPIVALTTMPKAELIDDSTPGLFSGRLGKPVTSQELFAELEKHLPGMLEGGSPLRRDFVAIPEAEGRALGVPVELRKKAGELLGAVKMDDIRIFAQELTQYGKDGGGPEFRNAGKRLAEYADYFNIIGVKSVLKTIAG